MISRVVRSSFPWKKRVSVLPWLHSVLLLVVEGWASLEVEPSPLLLRSLMEVGVGAEWAASWAAAASVAASCHWSPLGHQEARELCSMAGLVTYSILFCWSLTINYQCRKTCLNKQRQKVCVSCFNEASKHSTPDGVLVSLKLRKQRTRWVSEPLKGKKPVQDQDEGFIGRNERNNTLTSLIQVKYQLGVIDSPTRQSSDFFFTKSELKKIEIRARPVPWPAHCGGRVCPHWRLWSALASGHTTSSDVEALSSANTRSSW